MATQRMAFYFCVFVYIFLGTMMTPAPRSNETKNELIIKIKKKKEGAVRSINAYFCFLRFYRWLNVDEQFFVWVLINFLSMLLCWLLRSSEFQDSVLLLNSDSDVDLDLNHDRPVFHQAPPFRASSVARAGHVGSMRHVTCVWGRFRAAAYFCFYYFFYQSQPFQLFNWCPFLLFS